MSVRFKPWQGKLPLLPWLVLRTINWRQETIKFWSRIIRDVGEELGTRIGSSILKCCKTKDSEIFTVRQV